MPKGKRIDAFLEKAAWVFLVTSKRLLTRLGVRNKQSCKRCGRNIVFDFSVPDEVWQALPQKYRNKVLCFDCFMEVHPGRHNLNLKEVLEFYFISD